MKSKIKSNIVFIAHEGLVQSLQKGQTNRGNVISSLPHKKAKDLLKNKTILTKIHLRRYKITVFFDVNHKIF